MAPQLDAIDRGYANYAVLREAGKQAGAPARGFIPAQLANAVSAADTSVGKDATVTGTARMADLANAAYKVLPSTVPDPGSPLRHAVGTLATAALGHQMLPAGAAQVIAPAVGIGARGTLPHHCLAALSPTSRSRFKRKRCSTCLTEAPQPAYPPAPGASAAQACSSPTGKPRYARLQLKGCERSPVAIAT